MDQHIIIAQINRFFREKMFCDITLISNEGLEILAHKVVLASVSCVFHTMFTSQFKESDENKVTLHDMDSEVLESIVKFAYTDNVYIKSTNVEKMWMAADMYGLNYIKEVCCKFVKNNLNSKNCISFMKTSELLSNKEIYSICWSYFLNNFTKVLKSKFALKKLFEFSIDDVLKFIKLDDLVVDTEEKIFDFIIGWIRYNKIERNHMLLDLMKCVRLYLLSKEGLQRICSEPYVTNNKDTMDHLLKEITKINFDKLASNSTVGTSIIFGIGSHLKYDESRVWYMDFRSNDNLKWKPSKHLFFCPRHKDTKIVLCGNGIILAIGGLSVDGKYMNIVEELDLKSKSKHWVPTAPLNRPRRFFTVCTHEQYVYVIGGLSLNIRRCDFENVIEYYDTNSKVWTEIIKPLPTPRNLCSATIYNNHLYVFGGKNTNVLANVDYYDFEKKNWKQLDPMPIANWLMGITRIKNIVYLVGGLEGCQRVFKFDLENLKWEEMPNLHYGTNDANSSVFVKKHDLFVCVNECAELWCERLDTKARKWQMVDWVKTKLRFSSIIHLNEIDLKSYGVHLNR
ncbi:kelch-like protein 28 [Adelges cooleyi]|uniref:kelch-like protein 28 n=1 Tax=Adelges cooleyi TaxID=133065 RepID=UPI00217FD14B|nr:kelch-like protein 28 [Adelges cooleyi]XP_050440474.1 kelch-like protein 28 [Adelges cooleyi]